MGGDEDGAGLEISADDFHECASQMMDEAEAQEKAAKTSNSNSVEFVDHFSLRNPSSKIRFRNRAVHVYNLVNDQLQVEHEELKDDEDDKLKTKQPPKHRFTVKRMRGGAFGLRLLRIVYTCVALLMLGYVFIFGACAILFQILEIPQYDGRHEKVNLVRLVATILSLPLLMHAMASLMVLATAFVHDIWNGSAFFRLLTGLQSRVTMEWICFLLYAVVPGIAVAVTTFTNLDEWLEYSQLAWYCSMVFSFLVFCALVFYHEISFCFQLMRIQLGPNASTPELAYRALVLTLSQRFAGVRDQRYLVGDSLDDSDKERPFSSYIGLYARSTMLGCNPMFETLNPPQRRYTPEEIRDSAPIVTNRSWSIEHQFCRRRFSRMVFAVSGEDALEQSHFASMFACAVLGTLISVGIVVGILFWMEMGIVICIVAAIAILCCCLVPIVLSQFTLNLLHPTTGHGLVAQHEDDEDEVLYQVWLSYAVSKPKEWYCWFRFLLDVVLLFFFPLVSMYAEGLPKNATLFLVLGFFSGMRIYFNSAMVLSEMGSLHNLPLEATINADDEKDKKTQALVLRARASEVLGKISGNRTHYLWCVAFFGVAFWFLYQAITTADAAGPTPDGGRDPILMLDDFYYPPQEDLSYPTCKLAKGFDLVPGEEFTYLYDYNMLAALAYEIPVATYYYLDKWFGEEDAMVDETAFVEQWRKDSGNEYSPVSFKLFSVPSIPGLGVVSVRGTQTSDDRLLNAQLYMSSIMTQLLRAMLPFGWVWFDIYDDLIAYVSWIGSEQLNKGAYYKVTTQFVNDLVHGNYTYEGKSFDTLRTTGVSLGGGIALITGAQTGAYTVAIAGVNPTLARLTFDPPLSKEAIKTKILNVHPERDYISAIGDTPRLTQTIACRTPVKNIGGCHSFWRVWCEFLYACGSQPRPVLCICTQYDFPEPIANGTRTFAQACQEEDAKVRAIPGFT